MSPTSQELETLRDGVAHITEELAWLQKAPITKAEWKARVSEWVKSAAGKSNQFTALMDLMKPECGHFFGDAFMRPLANGVNLDGVPGWRVGVDSVLCWLMGDEVEKRLHAMIDAHDYVPGLPMRERAARKAELLASRRELELKEESIICAAEVEGVYIARRADADPAVVLGYVA